MLLMPAIAACGALVLGLSGVSRGLAQDSTPVASPIVGASQVAIAIRDVNGTDVGSVTFTEGDDGAVTVEVEVSGLPAGEHGLHVHETGRCEPAGDEPFASAGDHFNPTGTQHGGPPATAGMGGTPEASAGHAGDLGNITVAADGTGSVTVETHGRQRPRHPRRPGRSRHRPLGQQRHTHRLRRDLPTGVTIGVRR
jgi:Cu-Zn family superoxide dismutase